MESYTETMRDLETLEERELRNSFFELDGEGPDPGSAYPHQLEGLRRIELGASATPWVSGILHYPTGAGKTRVGMELIARALHEHPNHRFIWATHARNLIRQTMVRMAELTRLFPKGTRFTWADADDAQDSEEDFHVVFLTRKALTDALDRAGDGRFNHRWRRHLTDGHPLTLIYDECHQLGAEGLQQSMRKFYAASIRGREKRWRVIGLSATPVPTRHASHDLLSEHVFPVRKESPSTSHTWPFHVFQKVRNDTLVKQGVLCNVNLFFDRHGEFDLPADLLRKTIGDARLKQPGRDADPADVQKYAMQFNSKVMGDGRVIDFLASRIGENLRLLGKTIVFVPNIAAANLMASALYEKFPQHRGSIAAVHSGMDRLSLPGQKEATVHDVLNKFRRLGDKPSVLVNVDMLTEGFDDPKVQTVVIARLTLSTNRFWQMIGRGTRGPATRPAGTTVCNVVDPIKLTRVYDYFAGYQPSFAKETDIELEESEDEGAGEDRISPQVPHVERPPEPSAETYSIDPELARVNAQVALALEHFLRGEALSEAQALGVAQGARVTLADGHVVLRASEGQFDSTTATAVILGEISSLERRSGFELGWFRLQLPEPLTPSLLKQRLRMLRAIESLKLWTESAFAEAQMSGDFLTAMKAEAQGGADGPRAPRNVHAVQENGPAEQKEAAVLDAVLAMAGADGHVVDAEVAAILETLRRMFGRTPTAEVEAMVRSREVPTELPYLRLEATLSGDQRQLLLLQLAEVAAADRVIAPEERTMLAGYSEKLGVPPAFVDAVLGGHLARADVTTPVGASVAASTCAACAFVTPMSAAFCPSCGAKQR